MPITYCLTGLMNLHFTQRKITLYQKKEKLEFFFTELCQVTKFTKGITWQWLDLCISKTSDVVIPHTHFSKTIFSNKDNLKF